jgi:hypothetical protein
MLASGELCVMSAPIRIDRAAFNPALVFFCQPS